MTNLYTDTTHCIVKLDKGSNRMKPFLFNSRSAVLDGEWNPVRCSVQGIFHDRTQRNNHAASYNSTRLLLSVTSIVNSFEFISCLGIARLFGVDRTTAYRVIKAFPHVKDRGRIAIPTMHGISAVFHSLMKNMYAMHRKKNNLSSEEFHFLKSDEASSMLLVSEDNAQERFVKVESGLQLPRRTKEMLDIERRALAANEGLEVFWVGAIPFIKNHSEFAMDKSRHITFCEVTGVPLGNYMKDFSIYGTLMRVELISPMFPQRRDHDERNAISLKSISELAFD